MVVCCAPLFIVVNHVPEHHKEPFKVLSISTTVYKLHLLMTMHYIFWLFILEITAHVMPTKSTAALVLNGSAGFKFFMQICITVCIHV